MIALEAQADIMLRNVGGLFEGHLRIGATGYYIMDAVGRFSHAHPSIALTCRIGNSEEILQALQEFRIDLAVSSQRNDADGLERKVISTDPLVLVVHRNHPLARFDAIEPAQLADVRLLIREEGSVTRRCTDDSRGGRCRGRPRSAAAKPFARRSCTAWAAACFRSARPSAIRICA